MYAACEFPKISLKCGLKLEKASAEVGPHNIYDIYDNCPATDLWLKKSGKSMRWLKNHLRSQMDSNVPMAQVCSRPRGPKPTHASHIQHDT